MRRLVGTVASGLGMFLVVLALLLHFYTANAAVKFPLNTYTVSTLIGHDLSYFNTTKLTELSGVTMRATNTTVGDAAAGNTSRAVYNSFTYIYDETNRQTFQYSSSRMAFDRKTGLLLNCCGAAVGTDTHVHMSGLGPLFPLYTKAQNYEVFNTTLLKPVEARYSGKATIDGLQTYKFVISVPATKIGTQAVPGSLIGSKAATVPLGEYFQGTTTDWIDPTTGVPVAVTESQHVGLRDSTGAEKLVVLDGTLSTTPSTVRSAVNTVNKDVNLLNVATIIVPLIAGIVGLILLVVGIIIFMQSRRSEAVEETA